jgi:hypothetical protein
MYRLCVFVFHPGGGPAVVERLPTPGPVPVPRPGPVLVWGVDFVEEDELAQEISITIQNMSKKPTEIRTA